MLGRASIRSHLTNSSDEMEHCEGGSDDMGVVKYVMCFRAQEDGVGMMSLRSFTYILI